MATAITAAIIVYGSLYPFRFYGNPNPNGPLGALWQTRDFRIGFGAILANLFLYAPLGFFWVRGSRRPRFSSVVVATVAGTSLSALLEIAQFYDAGRFPSMWDVYMNDVGALCGAIAALLIRNVATAGFGVIRRRDFVLVLLLCWLGYRLFPFAPVIDLHKYWDAVRPLIVDPSVSAVDVFRHTATWLAVAVLLESVIDGRRTRWVLLPIFAAVVFARMLIVDIVLSPAEIVGGLLGVVVWIAALSQFSGRRVVVAGVFIVFVVFQALAPFNFSNTARPFGWIPFRGLLVIPEGRALLSFFEKTFTYGSLVWLLTQAGGSFRVATASGAILVFVLRLMQVRLPGRSAEITDVVLLLTVAAIMWLMSEDVHGRRLASLDGLDGESQGTM